MDTPDGTVTNPNWESRHRAICDRSNFVVIVQVDLAALRQSGATPEECDRLATKLKLVEVFAAKLAVNMGKGTIKYPHDNWDIEAWLDFEDDDTADSVNYRLLRTEAMKRANLIHTDKEDQS
jgi:hypothetical protein